MYLMDKPLKFQIPNETPLPVAKALRTLERHAAEIVDGLNNPAERLAFYGAGAVYFTENQKAIVLPGTRTQGAAAGDPGPESRVG